MPSTKRRVRHRHDQERMGGEVEEEDRGTEGTHPGKRMSVLNIKTKGSVEFTQMYGRSEPLKVWHNV